MRRRRVATTADEELFRSGPVEAWVRPEEVAAIAAAVEAVDVDSVDVDDEDLQEVADVLRVLTDDPVPYLALWWQAHAQIDADHLVPALAVEVATSRRRAACRAWAEAHRLSAPVAAARFGLGWC